MASSYSTDLKLELMVTGENAGTWGDITNTNLNFQYESGIRLNLLTDYFELYLPFYSSLGNELNQSKYLSKIRFKISIDPDTLSSLFTRRWF